MSEIIDFFLRLPLYEQIVWIVSVCAFAVQIVYWIHYSRINRYHFPNRITDRLSLPPVSVIVVVNGSHYDWLAGDFRLFFSQDHPNFELVVVNDCGGEEMIALLQKLSLECPILKFTSIPVDNKFSHTQKVSTLMGIKAAKFDNMIFIEPWSRPSSDKWLSLMSQGFGTGKQVVVGSSLVLKNNCSGNGIIRPYRLMSQIRSLNSAIRDRAYRASRTNFGFTKQAFYSAGGYNYLQTSYGDNDLFVQRIANRTNVSVIVGPGCQMLESLDVPFSCWFREEKFLTSTFRLYPFSVKLSIFAELLTSFVLWMFFFLSAVNVVLYGICNSFPQIFSDVKMLSWLVLIVSLMVIRVAVVAAVLGKIALRLGETGIVMRCLAYDKIAALWESFLSVSRRFGDPSKLWR